MRSGRPVAVLAALVTGALVLGSQPLPASATTPLTGATYLYGNARTGYNSAESAINAATAPSLTLQWSTTRYWSTVQPIVSGGQVLWSDWHGTLHATDTSSHTDNWTASLGTTTSPCGGVTGPDSSATLATVGGTPTVFIGGGTAQFEALDARTGEVLWATQLSTDAQAFVWSSPALFNGSIFVGVASTGDCPSVRGKLVKLDALTGAVQATFYAAPEGCIGGGIWSSPAIDEMTGTVYVTTGNADLCPVGSTTPNQATEPLSQAIISLRASDLSVVDAYQPPDNFGDSDFGATPMLFNGTVNGHPAAMVGAVNKNGYYYAFNRDDLAAGPVWTHFIGVPGQCSPCNADYLANASYDGSALYVAGDHGQINGVMCPGTLTSFDPGSGAVRWADCLQQGRVLAAVVGAPGIVEVNAGSTAIVVDDATGAVLFSYGEPSGNYFWSPAYFADGVLYLTNNDGTLEAFAPTALAPQATAPEVPAAIVLPVLAAAVIGGYSFRRSHTRRPRTV